MNGLQKIILVALFIAAPAAAHSFFAADKAPCFTAGDWTYQLSPQAPMPDYRVQVTSDATPADLSMQLVDSPELADFVLADDVDASENNICRSATGLKVVRAGGAETQPDITVALSRAATTPDYRVYVNSTRFSHEDVAALVAVMWKTRQIAQR
ncbi:MAG: hypothetical protein AB7K04_12215 [Pseudorhodoplanes sp.]